LKTSWTALHGDVISDISTFYAELSKASHLQHFYQYGLGIGGNDASDWIELPNHLCVPEISGEVEGYAEIEVENWSVNWKGQDEVKRVLAELAVHFQNE
jgi:hypothetical protein